MVFLFDLCYYECIWKHIIPNKKIQLCLTLGIVRKRMNNPARDVRGIWNEEWRQYYNDLLKLEEMYRNINMGNPILPGLHELCLDAGHPEQHWKLLREGFKWTAEIYFRYVKPAADRRNAEQSKA